MKHQSHATLTALLFLSLLLVTESPRYLQDKSTSNLQQQIATQVLRFHIRANSDTVADQQKKLRIKQSLLEWLTPILSENTSKSETIQCIRKNLPDIRKEATRMAAPEPVTVTLQKEWFPEKTYGTCTFPEGIYDALRVDIGQAKGHNWWCVMFPPLCFVDETKGDVDSKELEKELIGNNHERSYNSNIECKFKIVEVIKDILKNN